MNNEELLRSAKTWKKGDMLRFENGTLRAIEPGMYWYEGFGLGTLYLSEGRAIWCSRAEGKRLCLDQKHFYLFLDCFTGLEKKG